jgi:hypothetical protein
MQRNDLTFGGFNSPRRFSIWFFTKSHGQLLLLSEKGNTEKTRIELLFSDVAVVNLPIYMRGLKVAIADEMTTKRELSRVPPQLGNAKKLFLMDGVDWSGHVVAASVWSAEADREFDAPSDLIEPFWSSPFPS